MACTHPSDYLLINFFNKDVVWDAGFLEGFFGEVGEVVLLDNLIHMCLMLCIGNAAQTKLQRRDPEISLARERNIHGLFAMVRWSVVTDTCLHSGFPVTGRVVVETKQIFVPLARQAWVCTLRKPVSGLAMREVNLFFSVGDVLWNVSSVDGSLSKWKSICSSFKSPHLAQSSGVQQIKWLENLRHLAARLVL